MAEASYSVTDDSGFLALVDPDAYSSFVSPEWTLEQLVEHFKSQMRQRRLVIWGTGREAVWKVEVREAPSNADGFREFSTPINASGGRLLLTNYESLTMAAQFSDVTLPQRHELESLIPVHAGLHHCRVIQRLDPDLLAPQSRETEPDFIIELCRTEIGVPVAECPAGIPWTTFS